MDDIQLYKDEEFYPTLHFSWPQINSGFKAIRAAYPTSLAAISEQCLLTCIAGDYPAARELFATLKGRIDKDVWHKSETFTYWRDKAFGSIR